MIDHEKKLDFDGRQDGQREQAPLPDLPPPAYTRRAPSGSARGPGSPFVAPVPASATSPRSRRLSHTRQHSRSPSTGYNGDFGYQSTSPSAASSPCLGSSNGKMMQKSTNMSIAMGVPGSGHYMNHIVIRTKASEPIQGKFWLDPTLDVPDHASPLRDGASGKKKSKGKGRESTPDGSWKPSAASSEIACNAFLEANRGEVDVEFAIGASSWSGSTDATPKGNKAQIEIKSKWSTATVKIVELAPSRTMSLNLSARGAIDVRLPRNFSGALLVKTNGRGEITLLPHLASCIEVVSARSQEALVMVKAPSSSRMTSPSGSPTISKSNSGFQAEGRSESAFTSSSGLSSTTLAATYQGNYANLVSDGGSIMVGFIGEDPKADDRGIWRRFIDWCAQAGKDNE